MRKRDRAIVIRRIILTGRCGGEASGSVQTQQLQASQFSHAAPTARKEMSVPCSSKPHFH